MSFTRDYILIGDFSVYDGGRQCLESFARKCGLRIYQVDDHVCQCLFSGLLPDEVYDIYEDWEWKEKPRIVVVNGLPYHENIKMIEEPGVQFEEPLHYIKYGYDHTYKFDCDENDEE
ncbi:hypothetical protein [Adonisia turfae]|uniref:Uncharacterized protein n=1 Tax=Adonisia turfae CCMR0081 TaxID=2292702 RepID=A0A6M0RJ56_9CYAN|nr:hypothetical protein [Adonisia turfae]NEZ56244.1 hypothetical protein [Adonisia turfae CCMR0081]